ncbi:MAG: lipopolysaccharide transport periplasmic protein LptA [Alphaproteobacteria bacterium]|jgi:lipopolysaccharide export system protein LptA|nr:lipopolysaccharide transport periplasmic protein LptA [Rhodospirillaceae bacterium]MDP6405736.1 lipopolysaccharide transport periplasmic protein LptA [Alphaproteobacteria bacterium]MDP6621919.1 lipopolysaccharide transport periplasmic protein LptA [Alphaproteobacteria bacterium]|tara:strand:+ start:608 stop:1171 length:564 start_codon:yes stop_codon:yes gene_type:complete
MRRDGIWQARPLFPVLALALTLTLVVVTAPTPTQAQGNRDQTEQPIEITADQLEVQQDRRLAIFRGNVLAIQGTMRLRAATLVVHYRPAKEDGMAESGISSIEASGRVFFSTAEETAEGDSGVYDVDKSTVTLKQNVVLTRGNNVIRGNRLVLNLESGRSKVEGAPTASGKGGRVRGLFVPRKKPKR